MKLLLCALTLPVVLVALPATVTAAPVIGASPSPLAFGNVLLNTSSDRNLTIQNLGDANLSVTGLSIAGTNYSLVSPPSTPFNIAPGGSTIITVRLSPTSLGFKTGDVTIVSNDPVTPSKIVQLTGNGVAGILSLSPMFHDYGDVNLPGFANLNLIVGNSGNASLTLQSHAMSGPDSTSFSVISGPSVPLVITPGSTYLFVVRFTPATAGAKNATLTFASTDPVNPTKAVTLQGTGIGPVLTITGGLSFGEVHVDGTANLAVSLGNGGGGVLSITDLSIAGTDASSFSLVSPPALPVDLASGASVSITVQFAPVGIGPKTASLVVTSNDSESPITNVPMTGVSIRPEPLIVGVRDVPNDQGGKIKLSWDASTHDTRVPPIVDHYWILRSVPPQTALARIGSGARARPIAAGPPGETGDWFFSTRTATSTIYWELLATVQALHFIQGYSYVAPTTSDSTPTSNPYTLFMVMALNAANTSHWDSAPDSGYSVDNLSPAAPAPLTGSYLDGVTHLHWNRNAEADLAGYRVYRGPSAGFVPGPSNQIGAPPDTGFADSGPAGNYYKVSAVDVHGNESAVALLAPGGTLDVPVVGASGLALSPPWPNPAKGSAELVFALPAAGAASLRIYDGQGRRVRTLIGGERPAGRQSVRWDGRDEAGHAVGSGVYFARLKAAGRSIDVRFAMTR